MLVETGVLVLSGLILYGSKKAVVDPILEYRSVRKDISKDLVNYANVLSSPGYSKQSRINEARQVLREDASELKSAVDNILVYGLWSALRVVPSKEDVDEVRGNLIGLSNSVEEGDPLRNHEMREEAEMLLGLG